MVETDDLINPLFFCVLHCPISAWASALVLEEGGGRRMRQLSISAYCQLNNKTNARELSQ